MTTPPNTPNPQATPTPSGPPGTPTYFEDANGTTHKATPVPNLWWDHRPLPAGQTWYSTGIGRGPRHPDDAPLWHITPTNPGQPTWRAVVNHQQRGSLGDFWDWAIYDGPEDTPNHYRFGGATTVADPTDLVHLIVHLLNQHARQTTDHPQEDTPHA